METFLIKASLWIAVITLVLQLHGCEGCLEKERMALMELKAFFKSISTTNVDNILISWVDDPKSECCNWEQVKCNANTRRITELFLESTRQFDYEPTSDGFPLLNLSLFSPLEELQNLDLSFNNFEGCYGNQGSDSLRTLKQLKILKLSSNLFNDGILPYLTSLTSLTTLILDSNFMVEVFKSKQGLGNLRNLELLNLELNYLNSSLLSEELANLKRLKFLDLSDNLVRGSLLSAGICELKNLVELDLSWNHFDGQLPRCFCDFTYLQSLDLSYNGLIGNLPSCLPNLKSLRYLSFSENNFEGLFSIDLLADHSKLQVLQLSNNILLRVKNEKVPRIPKYQLKVLNLRNCDLLAIPHFLLYQYDLRFIDLSHNKMVGNFPDWLLLNNTKLKNINMMNNFLSGILQLPKSKHELTHLDISNNKFSDQLPRNIGKIFTELWELKMSENSFEGSIPSSMGEMKKLQLLDLSSNNFSEELPWQFVTGCFSLSFLSLSDNNFQGKGFLKYMNWTNVRRLFLNNNHFSGEIEVGLLKATQLSELDLSNNLLSGQIPYWVGNLSYLEILSLSNNLIEGNVPVELSNLKYLSILDISENSLGSVPSALNLSSLQHLYMHKNIFNGSISNALRGSSRLITLDLRDNQFSKSIPHWIGEYSNLRVLLLRGNQLQGNIPNQLCQLRKLSIVDLSYNKLNGPMPACFTNMTIWTHGYDGHTSFTPRFASSGLGDFLGAYYNSTLKLSQWWWEGRGEPSVQQDVEFMTKNRYESYEGNILNYMTGLDLSCNELTGDIPFEIGNFQDIRALNCSHNFLSGSIPESFSNLKLIESLDLSHNKLSGSIPPQLTQLNFLSNFNVSNNNLFGPTPNTGQFANFDERNYGGNPGLCGPTINKSCTSLLDLPPAPSNGAEGNEFAIDMVAFYWSFAASFVTVILGICAILWINPYWRKIWFYFIDACIDFCSYLLSKYVFYQ